MSAEFCRNQAALQQQRAEASPLENVRRIAIVAAATWEVEALAAERREGRRRVARATAQARPQTREAELSENPDRGYAADAVPWPAPRGEAHPLH